MDAYCMVHAVLDQGLPGERLLLVVPEGSGPVFTSQEVADAVSLMLEKLGVRVTRGVELTGWEGDGDALSGLNLRGGAGVMTVPCAGLVYLHNKQVDKHLFKGRKIRNVI